MANPKGQPHPKSTKAEIEERVLAVYKLLVQGYSYTDIVRYCTEKYRVTKRHVDTYIRRGTDRIKIENTKTQEELREEANARYNDLYNELRKEKKFRDAGYIMSLKARVNGIDTVNHKHSGEVETHLSEADKTSLTSDLLQVIKSELNGIN